MRGQPAKVLGRGDVRRLLTAVRRSRHAERNRVIVLLSVKAGLRACEIAALDWKMVLTSQRQVGPILELPAAAAKKGSGRRIPLHCELRLALHRLKATAERLDGPVIVSERGGRMTAKSIVNWFTLTYDTVGLTGCSSHSGRRTFITMAARLVHKAGGSLRDVQQLAGHRSLKTTQGYIDGDADAQRRLIRLL
jgi:integrase/recombinase XerD